MILIYVVTKDEIEAKNISKYLFQKKLCACVNILPKMHSMYFWPEGTDKIEEGMESILLIKTLDEKYPLIKKEILKIHSYKIPCIFKIKIDDVEENYENWLKKQIC